MDLRQQLLRYKFDASSADPHKLTGFVDVLFRLDQDALNDTIKLSGFGDILKNRVLSALKGILGEHNDSDIRRKLNDLQTDALSPLVASKPTKSQAEIEDAEEQILKNIKDVRYIVREYPTEVVVQKYIEVKKTDQNDLYVPDYQRDDLIWSERTQSRFI